MIFSSLESNTSYMIRNFNIVLIGPASSGKNSLMGRLISGNISQRLALRIEQSHFPQIMELLFSQFGIVLEIGSFQDYQWNIIESPMCSLYFWIITYVIVKHDADIITFG